MPARSVSRQGRDPQVAATAMTAGGTMLLQTQAGRRWARVWSAWRPPIALPQSKRRWKDTHMRAPTSPNMHLGSMCAEATRDSPPKCALWSTCSRHKSFRKQPDTVPSWSPSARKTNTRALPGQTCTTHMAPPHIAAAQHRRKSWAQTQHTQLFWLFARLGQ